jgi:hypothetical protein
VQRARKFSAVCNVKVSPECNGKFLIAGRGRGPAHLGDLVGEELHDNAASGRTADGDVEVNVGVGHFDGIGCVEVVERELMGEDGGVEEAFWRGTCPALARFRELPVTITLLTLSLQ